ncbi:MAG: FlhB HrpN YscU SpaS Family, partial [Pseudomonadota bacterium]
QGADADAVVKIARRFGVPVVEDSRVARLLKDLPADQPIPPALFEAVAVILQRIPALLATRHRPR